jgi:hypothetical protein
VSIWNEIVLIFQNICFDLRSSSNGDGRFASLGTPMAPSPFMVPQRTVYIPQQLGAVVSIVGWVIGDDCFCVVFKLLSRRIWDICERVFGVAYYPKLNACDRYTILAIFITSSLLEHEVLLFRDGRSVLLWSCCRKNYLLKRHYKWYFTMFGQSERSGRSASVALIVFSIRTVARWILLLIIHLFRDHQCRISSFELTHHKLSEYVQKLCYLFVM